MKIWFELIVFAIIWISPTVWAWRTKHRDRKLITILTLVMPILGFLISLIIIASRNRVKPQIGNSGVYQCEHCGAPYRLSDYADNSAIYCDNCKRPIYSHNQDQVLIMPVHSENIETTDTEGTKKRSFWLWPSIGDEISAKNANNQGIIASIWCAVWLSVIFVMHIFSGDATSSPDLWELADVAFFLLIACGIYKIYRVAPIIGLFFYFVPRLVYWIQHGPNNILFGIIITLAYITSIRGAFAYHRFKKYDDLPFDKDSPRIYEKEF